ncbi:MAG TPA: ABC transporter permease [Pyrinomonadaceae bacterium]|nr:ABC transporter permease [Pyrinomonadaceae bacterium]
MGTILQDLRYGFRMLLKSPAYTFVAVLALALGIGANSAIFSVVNAVLLRPLPFTEPERLVILWEKSETQDTSVAYPNFLDWRDENKTFEQITAYRRDSFNLTGAGEPERLAGRLVTGNFFATLGVRPFAGRDFVAGDDQPSSAPTVMLGHGFWQRRFGGDLSVINRQLTLNDKSYTVVGITPADFRFGSDTDIYVPIGLSVAEVPFYKERGSHPGLWVAARLKPGATIEQARAELDTIMARLGQQYPETNKGRRVHIESLYENTVREVRPALLVLLGAVAFVLLIACANVANLLLARSAARQKEIAIRTALGAGRWRIMRQLLTESLLLAVMGGLVGLLLALWGTDLLIAAAPDDVPRLADARVDLRVLGFTLGVAVLTGLVFGLAPAVQASKTDLNESLKETERGSTGSRQNLRGALVVAEVALALVLLIGAGLMVKSLWQLQQVETGFDPNRVLALQLSLKGDKAEPAKVQNFLAQVEGRVKSLPGVEAVAFTNGLPFAGAAEQSFGIAGQPPDASGDTSPYPAVRYTTSPGYLQALGIKLRRGRYFTPHDRADSTPVVVIDETLAQKYFPNQDPLGQRLQFGQPGAPPYEIVGVVGHVKHYGLDGEVPVEPQFYLALDQVSPQSMSNVAGGISVVVRTRGEEPQQLAGAVRAQLLAIAPDQPVFGVRTMKEIVGDSIGSRRFSMVLLLAFASVALVLAAVGIYGVMAYSVTQRTHEIGIRMALGAQADDVLRMVLRQGLLLILTGIAAGLFAAFALTRVLAGLLYGVSATDPLTFACISLLLVLVALVACYLPARRATKVDPMVALRYE